MRAIKRWFNRRWPYRRVCLGPWYCWRVQTNQHRCYVHQHEPSNRFYVQEHEVFGDGDRVIWTSEPMTKKRAMRKRDAWRKENNGDTWFSVVSEFFD